MSKPIDQELLPCPFCGGMPIVSTFPGLNKIYCSNQPVKCGNRSMYKLDEWQARAAVQPAGGAVPEGYALAPVEPTHEMDLAGIGTHLIAKAQEEGPCHWQWSYYGEIYRAMLAAAPHPVSGDRKAQDLDGLVAFANAMIDIAFEDGEADGGHIQKEAEKHGLLVKHERQSRCQEEFCNCAIYGFPTDCYVRSEQLRAHRAQQGEQP